MMNIINVFLCVRNNENTLQTSLELLNNLEIKHSEYIFRYYIYENDSLDNTKKIIIDFFKNHSGSCVFETLHKKEWGNVKDINRTIDMSLYRNKMKSLCTHFKYSDFSIILDTNITFDNNILSQMINIFCKNENIQMITPFGFVKGKPKMYYDTFALDLESKCKGSNKKKLKYEMQKHNLVELKSGFAGFIMIRTKTLQECNWEYNKLTSEHNEFCKQVLMFGKIVCASNIKVCWKK